MKKIFGGVILVIMVFGISLMNVTNTVEGLGIEDKLLCSMDGECKADTAHNVGNSWMVLNGNSGTTLIPVARAELVPPPDASLEIVSDGVKTSGPCEIAISTRGAQFGWNYRIYQLTRTNSWTPLTTTIGFFPDEEGQIITSALAPSAGTYAIFGSFSGINIE